MVVEVVTAVVELVVVALEVEAALLEVQEEGAVRPSQAGRTQARAAHQMILLVIRQVVLVEAVVAAVEAVGVGEVVADHPAPDPRLLLYSPAHGQ